MSGRIQELAEQAKKRVPAGLVVERWIERYNEELAKLIIDDCVSVIYSEERMPYPAVQPKSHYIYESAILEHFGLMEK